MKAFTCIALIAFAIACATANPVSSSSHNQEAESEVQAPAAAEELTRLRKSAYGGSSSGGYGGSASIPAPPCAKNYLFSCQPNLAPVPCSAPAPAASYGSQGAYSAPVPTYIAPFYGNYGAPQAYSADYVPQGLQYFQY